MIRAYRTFRVDTKTFELTSVTKRDGGPLSDWFGKYTVYDGVEHTDNHCQECSTRNCEKCRYGFYAMKETKNLWNDVPSVFCEVLLSGRIIEGEKGYRAERMTIVSIINSCGIDLGTLKFIANKYGVPITDRKDVNTLRHGWVRHAPYAMFLFVGLSLLYLMPLLVTTMFIRPDIAEAPYMANKWYLVAIIGSPILMAWYLWQGLKHFTRQLKKKLWEPTI